MTPKEAFDLAQERYELPDEEEYVEDYSYLFPEDDE